MPAFVILALSLLFGPHPDHAHDHPPESFAEMVQKVIRDSREGFRPLKTFRIENYPRGGYWYEVSDTLPGATKCRVIEHPAMVYVCEFPARLEQQVVRDLGAALSPGWTMERAKAGKMIRFVPENPRRSGLVEVAPPSRAEANVVVTFRRPAGP